MSKRTKTKVEAELEVSTLPKELTLNMVSLKWKDASSHYSKYTKEQIEELKPIIFYSSGFVVRQDKDVTILAQSYIGNQQKYENLLLIPTSLILKEDE